MFFEKMTVKRNESGSIGKKQKNAEIYLINRTKVAGIVLSNHRNILIIFKSFSFFHIFLQFSRIFLCFFKDMHKIQPTFLSFVK